MLRIRYRNKVRLRKTGRFLLISLGVLVLVGILILVYADSLILYDRDGAHLGAEELQIQAENTEAKPRPTILNPIVEVQEGTVSAARISEIGGVYITTAMLKEIDKVTELVKQIEEPGAVLIELKSDFGNFYYTSNYADSNYPEGIDIAAVDQLLTYLKDSGFYMIASIPAFPDRAFVVENDTLCLRQPGGYGWMDSRGCYWLDPSNSTVLSHLMQLVRELADKGFMEVCFTSFTFPEGDNYTYGSDKSKSEVLKEAATQINDLFSKSETTVSIVTESMEFPVAGGRVYVPNVDGSQVERYVNAYKNLETVQELVFLSSSRDARFENQAVLRPLMTES